jgi:hypothetical protein
MPNMADLSTATKVLLAAGVLMFIDLFLSWQKACVDTPIGDVCGTQSGWHGWGVLIGLLLIALIIWEGITLAGISQNLNVPVAASMVSAALAAAILLFTIVKFLVDNEERSWPAWIGLLLAIAIAVGGWLKWKETPDMAAAAPAAAPPPPPPPPPPPAEPPPA